MFLYDLLFIVLFLLAIPVLAMRRKLYFGYLERLGFISDEKKCEKSIWLHAVSVGEIISSKELIKALKQEFPGFTLVITTITPTGNKIAKSFVNAPDIVTYLPLDIGFIIRRFIRRFKPAIFIALETEIWPNLIIQLSRRSIPKIILNGRISSRSFVKYRTFRPILKLILQKIDLFLMQSDEYAEKIIKLGADPKKVKVTGNMKFDVQELGVEHLNLEDIRGELKLGEGVLLLMAGCTHKGEEEIILSVYKRLRKIEGGLRLLIAPRHIERVKALERLIRDFKYAPLRVSQLYKTQVNADGVYLLDSIGKLKDYYAISTFTFVGGSLVSAGGHNILEPASFSKPIIFGKFMHNFSDIRDLFLANEAAIEVGDEQELEKILRELIRDKTKSQNLGSRARDVVDNNKGASARNLNFIKEVFASHERVSI